MNQRYASKPGFTLIELLVAISLTVLMLALIDTLFRDTAGAVTRGIATGKIIQEGLTLSDQIARDAEHMLGPGADGVLVIGQKSYDDVVLAKPQIVSDREGGSTGVTRLGGEIVRAVRSDQLLFFRDNTGASETFAVAPTRENTFRPPTNSDLSAATVRVWYGHLALTNEQGTDSNIGNSTSESGLAGGEIMGDPLANRWLLGRHPLFFAASAYGGIEAGGAANAFLNVEHRAPLQNISVPTSLESDMGPPLRMYGGLTDVADATRTDVVSNMGGTDYAIDGVELLYSRKRLRANPKPVYDASDSEFQYQAWQVAQMHPVLGRGISDFVVEFAGDYNNNDDPSNIVEPDGQIDLDGDGNIVWYTHAAFANGGGTPGEPDTYSFDAVRAAPGVDVVPTQTDPTNGEAYYVTSFSGSPAVAHADAAFVFRHDDDDEWDSVTPNPGAVSLWPYLIRVRYRLHDPDGVVMQGDGQHGKWFETIIAVNRA